MTLKGFILNNLEYLGYYVIGFILIVSGLSFAIENNIGLEAILISLGIFVIAWGISRKASVMTTDIAHSSFKETTGEYEDRRLVLREKNKKITFQREKDKITKYKGSFQEELDVLDLNIYLSYSIWKCKTYLDRGTIYKKYLKENDEEDLIHQVDCLFQDLCEGILVGGIILESQPKNHLDAMYDIISHFNRFNRDSIGNQHRRERIINNLKFLKRLTDRIIFFNVCTIVPNYLPKIT